jgi:hypothetical protein
MKNTSPPAILGQKVPEGAVEKEIRMRAIEAAETAKIDFECQAALGVTKTMEQLTATHLRDEKMLKLAVSYAERQGRIN